MIKTLRWLRFLLEARGRGSRIHVRARIKNPDRIHLDAGVKVLADAAVDGSRNGPGVWLGRGVTINPYAQIQGGMGGIWIGEGSEINNFTFVNGNGAVRIGRDVLVGPHVSIVSANHGIGDPRIPIKRQPSTPGEIVIEDGVWIGAGAVVLAGVRIGTGSVVGAGAVVTRSCEPGAILLGVPARCRRYRPGFGPAASGSGPAGEA